MSKIPPIIGEIASELGVTKISFSRLMKAYSQAVKDGFDETDFRMALLGMKQADKKYWSIYSIFSKTDYWVSQAERDKVSLTKGVWFND